MNDILSGKSPRVRKEIMEKVEAYHIKHAQMKKLERELKDLRNEIEPYMKERGLNNILNDLGKGVALEQRRMPYITARYSTYETEDLLMVLEPKLVADCIVEVVDRDIIDAMVKLSKIPPEVEELKKYSHTPHFVAK
jgi:hypothetical protein